MPTDKFKLQTPPPTQMTFGPFSSPTWSKRIICCAVRPPAVPAPKVEVNDTDSKDKLVAALKGSFDFCSDAAGENGRFETGGRRRKDSAGKQVTARLDQPSPGRCLGRPLRRSRNVSAPERCVLPPTAKKVSLLEGF